MIPGWINNRFMITGVVLAAGIGAWNLYVSAHQHGVVAGRVVDGSGRAVAGADVRLYQRNFVSQQEMGRVKSGPAGEFRFENNGSHLVQLDAERAGARSERVTVRLWFRSQDVALAEPLRLP